MIVSGKCWIGSNPDFSESASGIYISDHALSLTVGYPRALSEYTTYCSLVMQQMSMEVVLQTA